MLFRPFDDGHTLVVALDEVDGIIGKNESSVYSNYRCLLRALELLNYAASSQKSSFRCLVVLLSTSNRAASIIPCRSASQRDRVTLYLNPIVIDFVFMDVVKPSLEGIHGEERSALELFTYGRPLWASQWNYYRSSVKSVQGLVEFAQSKLLGSRMRENEVALFACRIGIGNIKKMLAENMVADNMATVVRVKGTSLLEVLYHPEPILCEASALHTRNKPSLKTNIVKYVAGAITNDLLVTTDKGDRGEMAAAAALIYTMDYLRSNDEYNSVTNNMSRAIKAADFIKAMVGERVEVDYSPLEGFTVNFTGVFRVLRFSKRTIAYAYEQNVAMLCPDVYPDVDLVVVMCKEVGHGRVYAPIIFQIKNWEAKIGSKRASVFLNLLSSPTHTLRAEFNSELAVGVLFAVGVGGVDDVKQPVRHSSRVQQPVSSINIAVGLDSGFKCLSNKLQSYDLKMR